MCVDVNVQQGFHIQVNGDGTVVPNFTTLQGMESLYKKNLTELIGNLQPQHHNQFCEVFRILLLESQKI